MAISPTISSSSSPISSLNSSPASRTSELSAYASPASSVSATSLTLSDREHILVPPTPTISISSFHTFLVDLPLRSGTGEFLLLGLRDDVAACDNERVYMSDALCMVEPLTAMGAVMGDSGMFAGEKWTWVGAGYNEGLDKSVSELGYYTTGSGKNAKSTSQSLNIETLFDTASSLKFTPAAALNLFASSNLRSVYTIPVHTPTSTTTLYLLERPPISFPLLSPLAISSHTIDAADVGAPRHNPFGPPTREEWHRLWSAWDLVTLGMIPPSMLHQKPIDLRHKCLFYIGHIPTFLDMLLSALLKEPHTEPKNFTSIFERGIDPHVDDPDHCHNHSEVPEADEDWPTLCSIIAFRDRVRARLMRLYDDLDAGKKTINRRIARVLQMTLEHEGFHVETLLYMLIQKAGAGTLPPPGFVTPPWSALAMQWNATPPPSTTTVTLGPATLSMGHDDSELDDLVPGLTEDVADHEFGWDNESPQRSVEVKRFRVDWRPVTNGEFFEFWKGAGSDIVSMPASWVEGNDGEIRVLTLHGPVPLAIAQHWPVLTSFDDLAAYACAKGGRIPTEPELRLFLDKYEVGFEGGANVGFRNWHPIPATTGCGENGKGSNGGVWEWTSTAFEGHAGFAPTSIFPGYSADFFDGKHQVVIGASYATIPRLAGRRTLRNFYQHNYPYPWVGARVAYDV